METNFVCLDENQINILKDKIRLEVIEPYVIHNTYHKDILIFNVRKYNLVIIIKLLSHRLKYY